MRIQHASSLCELPPGARAQIRTILFDTLRESCARAGLHSGLTVQVVDRAGSQISLALADGQTITLPREQLCFIEVRPVAEA